LFFEEAILEPPRLVQNKPIFYTSVSYIPHMTEKLIREFKGINSDIKVGLKPPKKVGNIFTNTKSKIEPNDKTGAIYRINCKGNLIEPCNGCYIGETSKQLKIRINQHKSNFASRYKFTNTKTALINHALENGHSFDFENPKILATEGQCKKRRFLESAHIQMLKPQPVNYKVDTSGLATSYCDIIRRFKKLKPQSNTNFP
jgi:GIY-YIG catalytic domain